MLAAHMKPPSDIWSNSKVLRLPQRPIKWFTTCGKDKNVRKSAPDVGTKLIKGNKTVQHWVLHVRSVVSKTTGVLFVVPRIPTTKQDQEATRDIEYTHSKDGTSSQTDETGQYMK